MDRTTTTHDYNWNDRLRDDGVWEQAVGKIKETWGEITDDELTEARGNWEQLVGTVKEKTGQAADTVEEKLREFFS